MYVFGRQRKETISRNDTKELKGDGKLQIQRGSEPKSIENKIPKPRNIMVKCMDIEHKLKIKSFLRKNVDYT